MTLPPASSTRPVPTRFRTPSASVMTRERRMPVFVWSKKATCKRPTWRWTERRISVIERWAALPSTWDSAKPVIAWTMVAAPGTRTIVSRRSRRPFPMTSSRRIFVVPGSTRPQSRLTRRRPNPRASRPFRAAMSSDASRRMTFTGSFALGLPLSSGRADPVRPRRSARIERDEKPPPVRPSFGILRRLRTRRRGGKGAPPRDCTEQTSGGAEDCSPFKYAAHAEREQSVVLTG